SVAGLRRNHWPLCLGIRSLVTEMQRLVAVAELANQSGNCIGCIVKLAAPRNSSDDDAVSRPRGFHLRPLAEPDMNLPAHPAPTIQSMTDTHRPMHLVAGARAA